STGSPANLASETGSGTTKGRPRAATLDGFGLRGLVSARAALATQPHLLGELRTGGRVVWGDHRIARIKAPLLAILFRGQAVVGHQVPLERLELLPVFQADDVVIKHGTLGIDSRLRLLCRRRLGGATHPRQGGVYVGDQIWQIANLDGIVADIG